MENSQEIRNLNKLLTSEPQISSFILENFQAFKLPHRHPIIVLPKLRKFQKFLKFLDLLGWVEHTGDWDPYLIITFLDGSTAQTESGYWSFEICENGPDGEPYIEIENPDEPLRYAISQIQSILLTE